MYRCLNKEYESVRIPINRDRHWLQMINIRLMALQYGGLILTKDFAWDDVIWQCLSLRRWELRLVIFLYVLLNYNRATYNTELPLPQDEVQLRRKTSYELPPPWTFIRLGQLAPKTHDSNWVRRARSFVEYSNLKEAGTLRRSTMIMSQSQWFGKGGYGRMAGSSDARERNTADCGWRWLRSMSYRKV
jgi:hypothetical protein